MPHSTPWKTYLAIFLLFISLFVAGGTGYIMFAASKIIPPPLQIPPTTTEPIHRVNFITVGDIMLSRNVARYAQKAGSQNWIWANIASFLQQSDFVFGNLEGTTNGTSIYSYQKVMLFNALPELIRTLPFANFAVLNLANNHVLDQGNEGISTTEKLLSSIGLISVGTGADTSAAWEAKIIERNGIKMAFLGASYAACNDNGSCINTHVARMQDTTSLTGAIQKAKIQADFVIVMMHAGAEYTREPTKLQKDFAHAAIEAGADIIFGAHPHWTQGIEQYQGKYIFYSLGNFVFDQEFSPETKNGLAVQTFLTKQGDHTSIDQIELHPILIENYGQPRLILGDMKIRALKDIGQTTSTLLKVFTK